MKISFHKSINKKNKIVVYIFTLIKKHIYIYILRYNTQKIYIYLIDSQSSR